ncbi:MAG: helix-turn-helix transcriptional regulator [Pseudomonadota bacterium]|nr:helix-turn-helix transcriptional regulator [Pseudomonadota bacterium]
MKESRKTIRLMNIQSENLLRLIATNVRRKRAALGLSQEQFADLAGYHRTYIGSIERAERNITISTLSALAEALNISVIELLSDSDA